MATQALFYENVSPVSSQRHRDWCVESAVGYEFARDVISVPLTTVEMASAAREYTIVFAGSADDVLPIVILGVEGKRNVYVTDEGGWDAQYIPAFVRRYPFVFSQSEDGKRFTLCIDESWSGCNQEGRGERLFDEQGEGTPYFQKTLGFVKEYQRQFQRTQDYCRKLKEHELLHTMTLKFTLPGDEEKTLGGFMAVNREKLKALPPETLADLAKTDELELTYTHLQSMNNFSLMLERIASRRKSAAKETAEEAEEAEKAEQTG